jgi:hypothetical protein
MTLEHHGLITVARGFGGHGIYWVRLWDRDGDHVAVATEVPGNPGQSLCNDIEGVRDYLVDHFDADPARLTLFEIRPTDCWGFRKGVVRNRIDFIPSTEFTEVSLEQIVAAVGDVLPPLPEHDDLYAQVLAAGGGVYQPIYWPIYQALPVGDIPVPHNPSRCDHYARFQAMDTSVEEEERVGRRFLETLTEADRKACWFHQADWKWIADESVRIITELGHVEPGQYIDAVDRIKRHRKDRSWLHSLFGDPIFIGGGGFTNGQHRACALRFSGATHAAMVVDDDHRGDDEQIWIYQGDG